MFPGIQSTTSKLPVTQSKREWVEFNYKRGALAALASVVALGALGTAAYFFSPLSTNNIVLLEGVYGLPLTLLFVNKMGPSKIEKSLVPSEKTRTPKPPTPCSNGRFSPFDVQAITQADIDAAIKATDEELQEAPQTPSNAIFLPPIKATRKGNEGYQGF